MSRIGKRLCIGLMNLLLGLILWQAALKIEGFAEWYAVKVYPLLVGTVGRFFGLIPWSAGEILLGLLILWILAGSICLFKKKGFFKGLGNILVYGIFAGGTLVLIFMMGCGINYHRLSFSRREGLTTEGAAREDLVELCNILAEAINDAAGAIGTYEDGRVRLPENYEEAAVNALSDLGEEFETLSGFYPMPKKVFSSRLLSLQQVTGIYSPFTIEANYNREICEYEMIFSVCHELSHLKGFMREDEANFIGWLACYRSEVPELRYSGALEGFVYAGNALYRYDPELYWEIRDGLCSSAESDLAANSAFWKQYEGKPAEIHEKVNDAYLKANSQTDGVESYGRVVELMVSYMRERE